MTQRFLSAAKYVMQQINPSNLSGAIDVVIVEQEDGNLLCSPFHVRFGKLGTLIAEGRPVDVYINGELVPELRMKLGSAGEAFFVEERRLGPHELPPDDTTVLLTSPITSDVEEEEEDEAPTDRSSLRWGRRSLSLTDEEQPSAHTPAGVGRSLRRVSQTAEESPIAVRCFSDDDLCSMASASVAEEAEGLNDTSRFLSDTLLDQAGAGPGEGLTWQWGELPVEERIGGLRRKRRVARRATVAIVSSAAHTDSDSSPERDEAGEEAGDEAEEEREAPVFTLGDDNEAEAKAEETKEETKEEAKDEAKKETEEEGKKETKDEAKKETKDEAKKETKDEAKKETEEEGKKETKDEAKKETKDEAKKETKDEAKKETEEEGKKETKEEAESGPGPQEAIYLSEVIERPELRDLYVYRRPPDGAPRDGAVSPVDQGYRSDGEGSSATGWPPMGAGGSPPSPGRVEEDEVGRLFPVHLSLCGFASSDPQPDEQVDAERFRAHMVLYEEFCRDPDGVLASPDLVVQLNGQYYAWPVAAPLLVASLVYQCELPPRVVDRLVQKAEARRESKRRGSYFSRWTGWGRSRPPQPPISPPVESIQDSAAAKDEAPSESKTAGDGGEDTSASCQSKPSSSSPELSSSRLIHVKTLRLTSAQLHRLKLNPGANTVEYRVTSQFQGTARCQAHIFLWRWTDRIVVSDIDGTITQSDVMGQLGPFLGRDVSQRGVATLYSGIADNQYRVLYLSSRAIGQAHWTRSYLQSVVQERGVRLPQGPMLLSPTSLLYALVREIRNRPEDFKIPCLRDVRSLFPAKTQPFYAGFGNKVNDVRSYQAVGIHPERIFVVDRLGALRRHNHVAYRTTYANLGELVHHFFPERRGKGEVDEGQFSNFEYWRTPVETVKEETKE